MKAGTTWLYSILKEHPSLYFTPEKEIHFLYDHYVQKDFLSDEFRMKNVKSKLDPKINHMGIYRMLTRWSAMYLEKDIDINWYNRIFSLNKTRKYNCDFSNLSCHLAADDWKDLSSHFDIKVIYILRDPLKRLWSHIKFHYQFSGKELDFHNWGKERFDDLIRKPFIWENVIYGKRIKSLNEGVRKSDLKILYFENLVGDPKVKINEITDFLRIERLIIEQPKLNAKINVSNKIEMPENFIQSGKEQLAPIYDELKKMNYSHSKWSL